MIELRRTYRFCSSHRLARSDWSDEKNRATFGAAGHPEGHGHNYRVTIVVAGHRDPETERVVDIQTLDQVVDQLVVTPFDHRNLNADVPSLKDRVPTAELLATEIWARLFGNLGSAELVEVQLQQDEFLTAVYRGPSASQTEQSVAKK